MSIIFILIILTARGAAVCLPILNDFDFQKSNDFPARIRKWNRNTGEFDLLEAVTKNGTALCSIDYLEHLRGKTISVSLHPTSHYIIDNKNGTITGYIGDVWTILEHTLQFRTIYKQPESLAESALMTNEVDTWLGPHITNYRLTGYGSFSYLFGTNSYSLFVLSDEVDQWWYVNIFSRGLWIMSGSFVVIISGLLLIVYRFKRTVFVNYIECNDELANPSFTFLNVFGVMTGQGFEKWPTSWSLRLMILSTVIMSMMLSYGFSSTLTSYLAVKSDYLKSLGDVVQTRSHSVCLRSNNAPYLKYKDFLAIYHSDNYENGMELVNKDCPDMNNQRDLSTKMCKPGFVYLETLNIFLMSYRQIKGDCQIVQIPGFQLRYHFTFVNAKSSTHRRVIDKYLLRLHSAGILKYLERKWLMKKFPSPKVQQWGFEPVKYGHMEYILIAFLIIMLISAFICILEIIWHRIQLRIERNNRVKRLNNFSKVNYNFPSIKLDSASKKLWIK